MRLFILVFAALLCIPSFAQNRPALDIYVIDVEGGNAVLFVAPSHESLLIDTGNAGAAAVRAGPSAVDDAHLKGIFGSALSEGTRAAIEESPKGLRAALTLGSPDFMRR